MIDIDERILNRLDNHDKTISDHCIRLTKIEQTHLYQKESKANKIVYLVIGIAITELLILAVTYLPLVPLS